MASFAKNAGKPKAKTAPTQEKAEAEDTLMADMSDDDFDDAAQESGVDVKAPSGKSKQDREAELKAMMDVSDGEMDIDETEELEPEPQPEEAPVAAEVEPQKDTVTVEGGRRRGRRKVTKKRTVRDEEGYLGKLPLLCNEVADLTYE